MLIGTRVQIKDKHSYKGKFFGKFGTVVRTNASSVYFNATNVAVQIDGVENPRSKYNAFWFPAVRLQATLENIKQTLPGDYRIACIRPLGIENAPVYDSALYDDDIKLGDIVVATSIEGPSLFQVIELTDRRCQPVAYGREIIAKADFTDYYHRQAIRKRSEELETEMAAHAKQFESLSLYESMAMLHPDIKAMLDEYKAISDELGSDMV